MFAGAPVTVKELISYQRVHPCPLETCACVASFDKIKGELTVWGTFQAPHVVRTVASILSGIPEHKIRIIAPDIGGGFGNKVGVYPGYVCAIVASIVPGVPVKWVEDRIENLSATAFARDYHMTAELAATSDGKILGLRCHVLADHGAFDACADPTKYPAGFFNIVTGSYDIPVAHLAVDGVYTNKAPGGVAYRCSFRVTEAAYCIERIVDVLAQQARHGPGRAAPEEPHQDRAVPVQVRARLGVRFRQLPPALDKAMEAVGYRALREEQKKNRADFQHGETRKLMGIGVAFFTEIVGAGPSRNCDILGIAMFDSAEIRVHPTGAAIAPLRHQEPGPGARDHLRPDHRDRDRHPGRHDRGRGRRHRHRALWPRHLRLALDAGRRRRLRAGRAQDPGQGAEDRRAPDGGRREGPRVGCRPLPGQGPAGEVQDHEGDLPGPPTTTCRRAWSRGWRRSTTTIRPT